VVTVWNDLYDTQASGTLLSTHKAKRVVDAARALGLLDIRPDQDFDREAVIADVCRVHDPRYVQAVLTGTPKRLAESQGFTWSPAFAESVLRIWSGHLAACRLALEEGLVLHPVSGAHHARRETGSGFCSWNFLVGAGTRMLSDGVVKRVAVIDLDAHQGDGTYALTKSNGNFSIFDLGANWVGVFENQRHLFADPADRQAYFGELAKLPAWLDRVRPDLVQYQAGMDPFEQDPVGGIPGMTEEALRERDRFVIHELRTRGIPTVVNFAGGYRPGATEQLHLGTIETMAAMPGVLARERPSQPADRP